MHRCSQSAELLQQCGPRVLDPSTNVHPPHAHRSSADGVQVGLIEPVGIVIVVADDDQAWSKQPFLVGLANQRNHRS